MIALHLKKLPLTREVSLLMLAYLYLPIFVLFTLNSLLGWLSPNLRFWDLLLNLVYPWLKPVTAT